MKIKKALKNLQNGWKNNKPTTIKNRNLIKILLDEELVEEKTGNKVLLKKTVNEVKLIKPKEVISSEIIKEVREILPTITGHVLLLTPTGISTHQKALENEQGGKILALIY